MSVRVCACVLLPGQDVQRSVYGVRESVPRRKCVRITCRLSAFSGSNSGEMSVKETTTRMTVNVRELLGISMNKVEFGTGNLAYKPECS